MKRRLLCVWLPEWPITRLVKQHIAPPDEAVATVEVLAGRRRIACVNAAAAAAGVQMGQPAANAQAICPALLTFDAAPAADAAALGRLALWAQIFTPLTAAEPPDGLLLDITGCAHLFGGEAGMRARICARLPGAQTAIADTAAAAWGLARFGGFGRAGCFDDDDPAALPLAALRLNDRAMLNLRRVGIRRVGELARLPRAEVTAGFGADVVLKLDRMLGRAPEPMRFVVAPEVWRTEEQHAEPLLAPAQLQDALRRLTEQLCARLAAADKGATAFLARFHRVDAQLAEIPLRFAAPNRDAVQIHRLLVEKLNDVDPGFGIEAIFCIAQTETLTATQTDSQAPAGADASRTLNLLLNRVKLHRLAPVASHIPERAVRHLAVTAAPAAWEKPKFPRPVRLFSPPVPITVIAPVPDDPPAQITWAGRTHRIRHATGPERIARDWWRHAPDARRHERERIRDYYAVEDMQGQRLWVFRAGVHEGEAAPRWFIHGVFG
jgi:protein ImuB